MTRLNKKRYKVNKTETYILSKMNHINKHDTVFNNLKDFLYMCMTTILKIYDIL
jgi:hypothetical protein